MFKDSRYKAGIQPENSTQHLITVHDRNNIFHKPILNRECVEPDAISCNEIQLPAYIPHMNVRTKGDSWVNQKIIVRNVEIETYKKWVLPFL